METSIRIVASLSFILTVWYLIEFFIFAFYFKCDNNSLWRRIGMPELFGIKGQLTYLSVVWGRRNIPEAMKKTYKITFFRLRILFVSTIIGYTILMALTL